jgi:hypothetical protein
LIFRQQSFDVKLFPLFSCRGSFTKLITPYSEPIFHGATDSSMSKSRRISNFQLRTRTAKTMRDYNDNVDARFHVCQAPRFVVQVQNSFSSSSIRRPIPALEFYLQHFPTNKSSNINIYTLPGPSFNPAIMSDGSLVWAGYATGIAILGGLANLGSNQRFAISNQNSFAIPVVP